MKITYNVGKKTSLAEPSLKSNIVPDAKRNQNFTYLYWRTQCHSLWRDLSCSSVLQKTETKMAFAKKGSFSSTFQPLSSSRINPGYHLCFNCWYLFNHVIASVSEAISRLLRDFLPRNDIGFIKHLRKLKR